MIDFIHPETSTGYNFFHYIRSTKDIIKIAHMLMTCNGDKGYYGKDPFWEEAAELGLEVAQQNAKILRDAGY